MDLAEALDRDIETYRQSSGPRVVMLTNENDVLWQPTTWWEWHFERREGWPAEWALKLGEVLNHLRALLDNTVWTLATAHVGGQPANAGKIKFPICDHRNAFPRESAAIRAALPPHTLDVIERNQPYNDSSFLPFDLPGWMSDLTMLQKVTNTDKHREMPLMTESVLDVDLDLEHLPDDATIDYSLDPAEDGDLLMRVEFRRPRNGPPRGQPLHGPLILPAVKVAATGETFPIVWLMRQMAMRTSTIVQELEAPAPGAP